jgi:hypothetical protein
MKNVSKIADSLHKAMKDPAFESFIAEQILVSREPLNQNEPCFSIIHDDVILDIWKEGSCYNLIKSVLPGHKKSGKSFNKQMKKKELLEEILKIVDGFLD